MWIKLLEALDLWIEAMGALETSWGGESRGSGSHRRGTRCQVNERTIYASRLPHTPTSDTSDTPRGDEDTVQDS